MLNPASTVAQEAMSAPPKLGQCKRLKGMGKRWEGAFLGDGGHDCGQTSRKLEAELESGIYGKSLFFEQPLAAIIYSALHHHYSFCPSFSSNLLLAGDLTLF